jgi:hypothetical protein
MGVSAGSLMFIKQEYVEYKSNIEFLIREKMTNFLSAISKGDDI